MADILDFLVAGPNTAFLIAGCVVAALFILEIVMTVIGHSMMMAHGDVDFTIDVDGNGIPDYLEHGHLHFGDFFNPGHIPTTMFVVVFCFMLSLLGYTGQWLLLQHYGILAPGLLATPLALVPTLAISRWATVGLARVIPQDETNSIELETLSGQAGILTTGPVAGPDDFGMARFADKYGVDHALVVGGVDDTIIDIGSSVVLLGPHPSKAIAFVVRKI